MNIPKQSNSVVDFCEIRYIKIRTIKELTVVTPTDAVTPTQGQRFQQSVFPITVWIPPTISLVVKIQLKHCSKW
jgi:hypothetical protein